MKYEEPQLWHAPTRQTLGAVLLEMGEPIEAMAVYQADLQKYPNNGWSLFGLQQCLVKSGRVEEAEHVRDAFDKAWSRADVTLTSSRF